MSAFTFGTGDAELLAYREPPPPRTVTVKLWRPCETEAEKVQAMAAFFEAVLYGEDEWGSPLFDRSKLDEEDFEALINIHSLARLYEPHAVVDKDLQWAREMAELLYESVALSVDPARLVYARRADEPQGYANERLR